MIPTRTQRDLTIIAIIAACAVTVAITVAQTVNRIRWHKDGEPILAVRDNVVHTTIEFGLRDDGVVVWREITRLNMMNSPAEAQGMVYIWPTPMTNI